ncbi:MULTISPECIES: response regulator transcription factor [Micromonospora]|uniref:response regulator transcription factor n=1 Tax=Micromonospora TaxID=1873 RepID=UPI0001C4484E|nr:response regulator transcription factor [Micromonospora sp. L5]ADU11415.1 response regulator receiver protein [Micromonospora sp. L5]
MTVHVAVLDPLPMYKQGVAVTLSAIGHIVETPEDPLAWVRRSPGAVVLLTLIGHGDWDLLFRLGEEMSPHSVIAVVEDDVVVLGVRAVRAGARSVIPRGVTDETLRRTIEATLDGQAVLPAGVAVALASGEEHSLPPAERLEWLRQLAEGVTVAQLAQRAGYSERAMFRLLQALYKEIGVRSRLEAIMRARDQGWLPRARPAPAAMDPGGGRGGRSG